MEYGRIVSRAFEIAWRHKWLWLFGMFAAGTGFNLKLEYILGTSPTNPFDFQNSAAIDPSQILTLYAGLIPFAIIFGCVMLLAKGAIIDSVNKIERGGTYSFASAFSAGIDYFLRFLGIGIIFFMIWMAYFIIVVIIVAVCAAVHVALAVMVGFVAFFLSFLFFIAGTQVMNLAERVVVLRNSGIMDALSEGVQLLKMHFGKNIAAFFILFGFGIAFGIFTFIFWFMLNFPINSVIQALNVKSFLAMLTAFILGLPVSYLLAGFFGLFAETFTTLFYIELVEPKPESAYLPDSLQQGNEPPVL